MDETEGFIVIRPWMIEMGLSGNELIVFALINGFSMDGKSTFNGGLEYLCNQTGIARRTAINCLKRLTEAGMIKKTSVTKNGVDYSAYSVSKQACKKCTGEKNALVQKVHSGSEKIARVGSEKIAPKKKDIKEKESKGISPLNPPKGKTAKNAFNPIEYITSKNVSRQVAEDYVSHRNNLKAKVSKTVVDRLEVKALSAGYTLEDAMAEVCAQGWRGFFPPKVSAKQAVTSNQSVDDLIQRSGRLIFGDDYAAISAS